MSRIAAASSRRIAAVTGATGVIGGAIAHRLAAERGWEVVLVCRNGDKAERTADGIRRETGNPRVSVMISDVSRKASVAAVAEQWEGHLHVLVNNASVTPRKRLETPEGIELMFATNVLGYFWMTRALAPILERSARDQPSRIVNVASYWAGDLSMDDLEFRERRYSNGQAYRQSKQAERMLTAAFARRLAETVTVNACHPGDASSALSKNLGFGGHESPEQAAETPVWLATGTAGGEVTGRYFEHRREVDCPFGRDRRAVEELYRLCSGY